MKYINVIFAILIQKTLVTVHSASAELEPLPPYHGEALEPSITSIVNRNFSVFVGPVQIIPSKWITTLKNGTSEFEDLYGIKCKLSIHRHRCAGPSIASSERITWNTELCLKWSCAGASEFSLKSVIKICKFLLASETISIFVLCCIFICAPKLANFISSPYQHT